MARTTSQTNKAISLNYRSDIDGLRAIAVLAVVAYHAFPVYFKGGFIGVDVFFVISGYLISTIILQNLEQESFSFIEFYSRRIKRLFPALTILLITCSLVGWLLLLPNDYKQLGKHIAGAAGFISNFVLWKESGYFDSAAETKPLLHLWSLGVEEQFYVVWPLILWVTWKKKLNGLIVIIAIMTLSFFLNLKGKSNSVATFYFPQTRFWELLLGSLTAYITLQKNGTLNFLEQKIDQWKVLNLIYQKICHVNKMISQNILSLVGFIFLILSFLFISKEKYFPGTWALLPTVGATLIIAAGSQALANRLILSNRLLVWFGLISFPLYLWHWPLLFFERTIEDPSSIYTRFSAIVLAILLAWLTYLVEKPIRYGSLNIIKPIVLFILMIIIGGTGYAIYIKDGFTHRFGNIIQDLARYQYDYTTGYRELTCFLKPDQNYKQFKDCGVTRNKNKKTILLWGDSHAAHLYPGYKKTFENKVNIIQRTASACPPIIGLVRTERKFCKEINDETFELIKREKPDKIILSAAWTAYEWKEILGLAKTIRELKLLGITNIDLIGPVPVWKDDLNIELSKYFKKNILHRLPTRMEFGLTTKFFQLDSQLKLLAIKEKIHYISASDILCNSKGCITMTGPTIDSLVSWDAAHLTSQGSIYLVSKFPQNIF